MSALESADQPCQQTSWLPPSAREVRVRLVLHGPSSTAQVLVETWENDEIVAYGNVPMENLPWIDARNYAIDLMTIELERQCALLSPF